VSWQSFSQVLSIKEYIRRRDGNRCVVCRIDGDIHKRRYGKILGVHRMDPKSTYSTESGVCVTVCQVCHDALHGKGHWGSIKATDDPSDEEVVRWVRRSSLRDLSDEEAWRKREAWGLWVKGLRSARLCALLPKPKPGTPVRRRKKVSPIARFARMSGLAVNDLKDFEAGRREPRLFEAKKLATALNITLEELATEKEPDESWWTLCKQRSHRRALVLRSREPEEGEIEALGRSARLVFDSLAQQSPPKKPRPK
jgi:hypothetical protein